MRKLLISILLAGAATSPALAQDRGRFHEREAVGSDHQERQQERQQAREQARAERSNRGNVEQAPQPQQAQQAEQPRPERAPRFEVRDQQAQGNRDGGFDRSRFQRGDRGRDQVVEQQQVVEQRSGEQRSGERTYRGYRGGYAGTQGPTGVVRENPWVGTRNGDWARNGGDFRQRDTGQRVDQHRRWGGGGWDRDWRSDRRYDWRSYRDRHRSTFRLGIYFDPFGYGYRSFNVGYRLQPLYYGQQYWFDPAMYGLPYPPPGTQWIRYWNDALLVDVYTGEVVDSIHNFFW